MKVPRQRLPSAGWKNSDYTPPRNFVEFIAKFLQLLRQGEMMDAGEENRLRRMKNYYLNKLVFPAMANLTFFFEALDLYPELRLAFKTDVMDLLGIRRDNPRESRYGFMFESLVAGMLSMRTRKEDYTVRLVHILEDLIWFKVQGLPILETLSSTTRVLQEIDRPRAWTELLSSRIRDVYDFDIIQKGIPGRESDPKYPGGTMEERERAFEEDANRKRPDRTFPYNTEILLKG